MHVQLASTALLAIHPRGNRTKYIVRLTSTIVSCVNASKLKSQRTVVPKNMHWWSNNLCSLRSKARTCFKAWSKKRSLPNQLAYRSSKAAYQKALRLAKCKAWAAFSKLSTPNDTFKTLRAFTGKSNSISLPLEVVINGATISDPAAIADGCANHFFPIETPSGHEHINCFESASWALQQDGSASPAPPVSDWEVETAIHTLNSKSAPGEDGVSADLLLFRIPLIRAHLFALLNACVLFCFFPNCWKLAKVVIIGKPNKSDYSSLNSFRPISLVSNLAKLLEKIVLGRLVWHGRCFNWLSDSQHGFREGRSTETAAHAIVSFVESGFCRKKGLRRCHPRY